MIEINWFLGIYIFLFSTRLAAELAVDHLNMAHLKSRGHEVPPAFEGTIDADVLAKISRYTADKHRLGIVRSLFMNLLFLVLLLSGIFPMFSEQFTGWHPVLAGLVFFAGLAVFFGILELPFGLYHTFVIEDRYGFNTKTFRLWLSDLFKSTVIGAVLGGALLTALLALMGAAGPFWWVWAWCVFIGFQLLVTVLYPTVIAPMFNTFTPLENTDLGDRIRGMAEAEGIRLDGIFKMDASQRTRHSNAYFTGLGKAKRIVLFDSLIESHSVDEILAVLAHEIGHLKKHHIVKNLLIMSLISLLLFAGAAALLRWETLYHSFGFASPADYIGLFLIGILWEPMGFLLAPGMMALSRRHERQADRFALRVMGSPEPMVSALRRLAKDNLSNIHPHPIYVLLNYSHPPLVERLEALHRAAPEHA